MFRNKYDGIFKNWTFDAYRAADGKGRSIWIANGFMFFEDSEITCSEATTTGLNLWDRWLLWREFKNESKRRLLGLVDAPSGRGVESEEVSE